MRTVLAVTLALFFGWIDRCDAQTSYPEDYFRHPLDIPMALVANFGEIRTNHWHMGLDIRTQQKVNLPVFAAAEGYIARVTVEPLGFGQAIYINHPNGLTTVYGHLNAFFPELENYVRSMQYSLKSWVVDLQLPPMAFPVQKGARIALSGSTGGSQGPHVHFEIRDTKTGRCLNPLLFNFPMPDAVAPTVSRLALYDREIATYRQSPRLLQLVRSGNALTVAGGLVSTASRQVSFAIGAVDRFTGYTNPNGIYSAAVFMDDSLVSSFALNNFDYIETRYINAQLDYPYKSRGGGNLQHISPLPGDPIPYKITGDGLIHLKDQQEHDVRIEVKDANDNTTTLRFKLKYNGQPNPHPASAYKLFSPNMINVFESDEFQLTTTERTIYDSIPEIYSAAGTTSSVASPVYTFAGSSYPAHDYFTVRIKVPETFDAAKLDKLVIRSKSGTRTETEKAVVHHGWAEARFRQFGTYQLLLDETPPTVNTPPLRISSASRIVLIPHDNFAVRSLTAEVDGQWLRFTNDKGESWIYAVDEHFPSGTHELKITVEDKAGNTTIKTYQVTRI